MAIYLLNTSILTDYGEWHFEGPISVEEAKARIKDGYISAIGHDITAEFLSQLLGVTVQKNRIAATLQAGDAALVLKFKDRLPVGKLITSVEEMARRPYELAWLKRIK